MEDEFGAQQWWKMNYHSKSSNCFKIQTPKPWSTSIDEEKQVWMKVWLKVEQDSMWILVNFQKKKSELWVNFGRWGENLQECFWLSKASRKNLAGVWWLSKVYWMNEIRALFIESRLGNFGGLELGLEIQIRLGIAIWREINN